MMEGDNRESAVAMSGSFSDERLEHSWDSEKKFGELFARALNLKDLAWDVYLLYGPGITWTGDEPPQPTFWMHQLPAPTGADGKFLLKPGRFSHELMNLLGRKDVDRAWDLALMLHIKGLDSVKRKRVQSSLEEVIKAVDATKCCPYGLMTDVSGSYAKGMVKKLDGVVEQIAFFGLKSFSVKRLADSGQPD